MAVGNNPTPLVFSAALVYIPAVEMLIFEIV
jgi:hypothetical protein